MNKSVDHFNSNEVSMEDLRHVAQDAFLILYFLKIYLMDTTWRSFSVDLLPQLLSKQLTKKVSQPFLLYKVNYFQYECFFLKLKAYSSDFPPNFTYVEHKA